MVRSEDWERATPPKLALFGVGFGAFVWLVLSGEPGFVFGLDHANLLFHEAGHPIVGLVSQRLETYGGTLGQLAFPVVLVVGSWRKGKVFALAASLIWFCENFLNIARYMADARQLKLPLMGGGDHDWNTILARWDLLQYDVRIADALKAGAWIGMGLVCAWVVWRAMSDRRRPTEPDAVDLMVAEAERLNS